jgi:hypothetical protein
MDNASLIRRYQDWDSTKEAAAALEKEIKAVDARFLYTFIEELAKSVPNDKEIIRQHVVAWLMAVAESITNAGMKTAILGMMADAAQIEALVAAVTILRLASIGAALIDYQSLKK